MQQFKTIKQASVVELCEKKSRFITHVFPITTQSDAEEKISMLKKQFWDAAHNCFAYQLGDNNEIQKFSDDGEPNGTAGKPILEVLKGEALHNVLVVVTRYFGGTLLGTGGLVRVYGKSAKEGVLAAQIINRVKVQLYQIDTDYTLSGKVQYLLNESSHTLKDIQYLQIVSFFVEVDQGCEETFEKWLIDKTNAEVSLRKDTQYFVERTLH